MKFFHSKSFVNINSGMRVNKAIKETSNWKKIKTIFYRLNDKKMPRTVNKTDSLS